jgi:hypothetical protein
MDRIHPLIGHGTDGFRLLGLGPAFLESAHGFQALVDARRDQLLGGRPLEDVDDPADALIDRRPRESGGDHRVADRLQGEWAEVSRNLVAVELLQRPERIPEVRQFRRRFSRGGRIVPLGMSPEREENLVDREFWAVLGFRGRSWPTPALDEPFGDPSIVLGSTLRRAVTA